jgi:hypothetical protein
MHFTNTIKYLKLHTTFRSFVCPVDTISDNKSPRSFGSGAARLLRLFSVSTFLCRFAVSMEDGMLAGGGGGGGASGIMTGLSAWAGGCEG